MKKRIGDKITARDSKTGKVLWQVEIRKIAKLHSPGDFEPTIMLVEHKSGEKELYFPYWKKTKKGTQGFANRPPMFKESIFLNYLVTPLIKDFSLGVF